MNKTYNGWKNYETWNIALWLSNDEPLYRISQRFTKYRDLVNYLAEIGITQTMDGVSFSDKSLSIRELNRMLKESTP